MRRGDDPRKVFAVLIGDQTDTNFENTSVAAGIAKGAVIASSENSLKFRGYPLDRPLLNLLTGFGAAICNRIAGCAGIALAECLRTKAAKEED